jgi:hypothetical protein
LRHKIQILLDFKIQQHHFFQAYLEEKKSLTLKENETTSELHSLFLWNDANSPQFTFLGCSMEKKMERELGEDIADLQILNVDVVLPSIFCLL